MELAKPSMAPRRPPQLTAPSGLTTEQDRAFIALLNGYRNSGGLHRLTTIQAARRHVWASGLADAMSSQVAAGEVLGVVWNDEEWVPDFQFDKQGAVKAVASAVFRELNSSHDPWELATWFITPSTWLQGVRPIDLIEVAAARVVEAARADRYVATGG